MIYQFPDYNTLSVAITSSQVPPEVSLSPAVGGVDADGRPWLEPSVALPRKAQNSLRRLGVQSAKSDADGEALTCWLQLLPVRRDPAADLVPGQAPVIFELSDGQQLPGLVGEMLRLGNDRQGFRWLKDGDSERVLLRVVGPPYYSLLQAIDRETAEAPRAYIERAPRVWVELGQTHPLIEFVKPPDKRLLFMRSPRTWWFAEDAPFQDIYDILEFQLPQAPVACRPAEEVSRLEVPLRLTAGNATDPVELWVVRNRAMEQVDALVRNSDDHLLNRLAFAVAGPPEKPMVIVRVRPSKQMPPALQLEAEEYRSFQKFTNLFMPRGSGLKPPLRRDAVRRLLADDPDQVVWLAPQGDGQFVPESLPDAAFRPLPDWVDYVLDHDHAALQAWVEASQFDFAAYVCKDEAAEPAAPKSKAPRERRPGRDSADDFDEMPESDTPARVAKKGAKPKTRVEETVPAYVDLKPSELEIKLSELSQKFLAYEGPLDASERLALWPEMARLHSRLGQSADAGICWANALWEADESAGDWSWQWAQSEVKLPQRQVKGTDFDRLLSVENPTGPDARALVSCVVAAASENADGSRQALVDRLSRVQSFLLQHEAKLGVRAVWLAWTSVARLSAGDVLNLARTRDRLLERLLASGLSAETDLASFLRFAGQRGSDRFRAVRERIFRLHDLARNWVQRCNDSKQEVKASAEPTQAYGDLMFAFGLARMGEVNQARRLQEQATEILAKTEDETHSFLLQAYVYRIEEAIAGRPHSGSLPTAQLEELEDINAKAEAVAKEKQPGLPNPHRESLFKINRLREKSRILDPQDVIDAYSPFKTAHAGLERELVLLVGGTATEGVANRLREMLKSEKKAPEQQKILSAALGAAARLGEEFAVEMLDALIKSQLAGAPVLDLNELIERAKVLERAMFLAAHFDRVELLQRLVADFGKLLESQRGEGGIKELGELAGHCLRSLRKLGLRDEIDLLLRRMRDMVAPGEGIDSLRQRYGNSWHNALEALLHIASGWLYFGRSEQAMPWLDAAREVLFEDTTMMAVARSNLTCAYVGALGQAPPATALERIEELFAKMGRIADAFTTSSHFSISQLRIIEAVVLAVVSDDFSLGQNVRRWLDEDEYLVRRRIHRDLRTLMSRAGL
jgi:hypothetical protein